MKTYSIGRDLNCDIVINDSTDVISRRHALLNVTPSGKMTLIDQSSNGTYVNGIRISPNVPVPVTRKDIISLAHVAKLDWNQVPKSNQWVKYLIGGIIAVIVILAVIFGMKAINGGSTDNPEQPTTTAIQDSTLLKQKEAVRLDSIKNVERQDSIKKAAEKAMQDSINAKKPSTPKKPATPKSKGDDKSKDQKDKKDKDKSQKTKRTIG
ncbi:MAG: FHA domain-containing protein [Muribaculaceae bacterium]|nr:FHA domain-containing protein [Muribaculaceae bacterium]